MRADGGARQQRIEAARRGHEVRDWRKRLKVDLKSGALLLSGVLEENASELATMKVEELLLAVPGVGRRKMPRVLGMLGLSPRRNAASSRGGSGGC